MFQSFMTAVLVTFLYLYVCYCFIWPYLFPATVLTVVLIYVLFFTQLLR